MREDTPSIQTEKTDVAFLKHAHVSEMQHLFQECNIKGIIFFYLQAPDHKPPFFAITSYG